jgi:hypothetical protein
MVQQQQQTLLELITKLVQKQIKHTEENIQFQEQMLATRNQQPKPKSLLLLLHHVVQFFLTGEIVVHNVLVKL